MNNKTCTTSTSILKEILKIHRRNQLAPSATILSDETDQIQFIQLPRIQQFVAAGKPVEFVLPAFPSKSPNPNKVLGRLPDLAERIALQSLNKLCSDIQCIYAPGARLTICSDGRVFGDVIGVDDADISNYQAAIGQIISQKFANSLRLYNLEDCAQFKAQASNFDELRRSMIERYAQPLTTIKHTLTSSQDGVELYRAITRFMFEDSLTEDYVGTRSALQKKAKAMAVEVIQRSWAWGDLLAEEFPDAIRLSIHPQSPSSLKIGIHMIPTQDDWITPWHGVAVDTGDGFKLMKRKAAQQCGAQVVMQDDHPSHYAIDTSRISTALAATAL